MSSAGGASPQPMGGQNNNKVREVQGQLEEVKDIMHQNIDKAIANTQQIEDLEGRTDQLRQDAKTFKNRSTDLKRIMWWRNMKLKIIIGLIILCILGYIFIPIIVAAKKK